MTRDEKDVEVVSKSLYLPFALSLSPLYLFVICEKNNSMTLTWRFLTLEIHSKIPLKVASLMYDSILINDNIKYQLCVYIYNSSLCIFVYGGVCLFRAGFVIGLSWHIDSPPITPATKWHLFPL